MTVYVITWVALHLTKSADSQITPQDGPSFQVLNFIIRHNLFSYKGFW